MIAFIIATKKDKLLSLLLENADEKILTINAAVKNANKLIEAMQASFKMTKNKMFGINQTKQFKSLKWGKQKQFWNGGRIKQGD